jgi:tetratricopeptide (TPR) repeat protein
MAGGILIFYSILTLARGFVFKNEITIRQEFVRYYPKSPIAHRSLAGAFKRFDLIAEAKDELHIAKTIDPNQSETYIDLAGIYLEEGRGNDAVVELQKAMRLRPYYPEVHRILCDLLAAQRRNLESKACFEEFLSRNPP